MDENPYRAPHTTEPRKPLIRRFAPWDWLALFGSAVYVTSTVVREVTELGMTANDYARIGHEVGGIIVLVWCAGQLMRKAFCRNV